MRQPDMRQDIEAERQRDRGTRGQRDIGTGGQRGREAERQSGREAERQRGRELVLRAQLELERRHLVWGLGFREKPVHLIITMMKWIRTRRLSINNSLSLGFRG